MAYDCERWCYECEKEYRGHDRDDHCCDECKKKKAEAAHKEYLAKKLYFAEEIANDPNGLRRLAEMFFDLRESMKGHEHCDPYTDVIG